MGGFSGQLNIRMDRSQFLASREYQIIRSSIEDLDRGGIIQRSAGYCFSISDVIYQLLTRQGIDCELVECRLTMISRDPPSLRLIGHDQSGPDHELQTHIVCVAKCHYPVVIDLAVVHLHPYQRFIAEPVILPPKPGVIAEFEFAHSTWLYQEKPQTQAPQIANKNIIDRMITERRIKAELKWLKLAVIVLIIIAAANFVRGSYDFYQTYINNTNNWGPAEIKKP